MEAEVLTKNKLRNDTVKMFIRKYIKDESSLNEVEDSFDEWLNTQDVEEDDKKELRSKFETGIKFKDAENVFYKIANIKLAGVKARVFYDEWVKEQKKGKGDEFIEKAKDLKVVPEKEKNSDFWDEFYRLSDQQ
jgi:hypothetical protein